MIAYLRSTASGRAGSELRIPRRTWSLVQRRERDLP